MIYKIKRNIEKKWTSVGNILEKNPLNSIGFFKLVYIFYYPWYNFFLYDLFSLKSFIFSTMIYQIFLFHFHSFFLTMESEPKIFRFQWASVFCCCFSSRCQDEECEGGRLNQFARSWLAYTPGYIIVAFWYGNSG